MDLSAKHLAHPPWATRIAIAATVVTIGVAAFAVGRGIATDTATAAPTGAGSTASDGTPVEVRDFAFGPQTVTIKAGGTVVWTNADQVAHSVKSGDDTFAEQTMPGGQSVSVTLDEAGTYAYICGIHPAMTGTIEVTP